MRHFKHFIFVVLLTTLLAACTLQPPPPRTITVSEARLAQLISAQFPFNSQALDVLDVRVSTPRIVLDAAANRINTSLDLDVAGDGILGLLTQKAYKGGIDLSYGLRFEPGDGSVRMTDVRVLGFRVDGAPSLMQRPLARLGSVLAQELLNDYVLYRLRADDLNRGGHQAYQAAAFSVAPDGLRITLEPLDRR